MKPKVFVAMSGGVDSSLSAILLKEQGYEVLGVTMQIWPHEKEESRACCSLDAVEDARRAADKIGIPHYVLNYRDTFASKVIDYFCHDYLHGRTPNPCVACNRYIKFGFLLRQVLSMGAAKLATGHYARIIRQKDTGKFSLLTGLDPIKDQSYFLCYLNQFQLEHTLFPLGELHKRKVRELAKEHGLAVADKPDSQEVCFVTEGRYHDFVEDYLELKPSRGDIRLLNGQLVGQHQGIYHYTVGQRRGLNLPLGYPAYVVQLDPDSNTVWIGKDDDLWGKAMLVEDFNYVAGEAISKQMEVTVKIRSGAKPAPGLAIPVGDSKVKVEFLAPQRAITPGQTAVLYLGEEVLGGGSIASFQQNLGVGHQA